MTKPTDAEQFKNDLSKFSGNYLEFLVIAKTKDGHLHWKSTDSTWAFGAANRYLNSIEEVDRELERRDLQGECP